MSQSEFNEGPWYKQFWLWFLLVPLFILMAGSFYLLYLSIVTNDGVVVDNFYRDGKGYVVRNEEDAFARNSHLKAQLSATGNNFKIKLAGDLTPPPEQLELIIIYPTSQKFDVTLLLQHQGLGEYTATLNEQIEGRRYLQLSPLDSENDWRLHGESNFPFGSSEIDLLPKQE